MVHVDDPAPHRRLKREKAMDHGRASGASAVYAIYPPWYEYVFWEYGEKPVGGKLIDSNRAWRLLWCACRKNTCVNSGDLSIITIVRVVASEIIIAYVAITSIDPFNVVSDY